MTESVRVVFRKYDGSLHWHLSLWRLGEDEHGVWLGHPAGVSARKGDEPPITSDHAQVAVVPRRSGWVGWFYADPQPTELYCDVTTVPAWPGNGVVTMVDLDLDVCRMRADGSVHLLDEDEFAEHQVRYGYPEQVIAEATRTAGWLRTAVGDRAEPFATVYHPWLALVSRCGLPDSRSDRSR